MVLVDLCKELVKFPVWNSQSSPFESCLELALIQFPIMVSIYRLEEGEELLFGVHNE